MTKARGAADSIGKAGRGASFLLPAFSPYYVPRVLSVVPALARTDTHPVIRVRAHTHICTPASLFFPSSPSSPATSRPILLRALHAVLFPPLLVPSPSSIWTSVLYIRVCMYTCGHRLNRRTRFHVARLYALLPRRRGRLCTWVNGKMSFETFLGRSRSSPLSVIHTRDLAPCRSRENARLARLATIGAPAHGFLYYISDAKRMYCRFKDSNIVSIFRLD